MPCTGRGPFKRIYSHLWGLWPCSKGTCQFTSFSSTIHCSKPSLLQDLPWVYDAKFLPEHWQKATCCYLLHILLNCILLGVKSFLSPEVSSLMQLYDITTTAHGHILQVKSWSTSHTSFPSNPWQLVACSGHSHHCFFFFSWPITSSNPSKQLPEPRQMRKVEWRIQATLISTPFEGAKGLLKDVGWDPSTVP